MAGQSITQRFGLSYFVRHLEHFKCKFRADKSYRYAAQCFRRKDYQEALTHFTTAILLAPEYPISHLWRGISYK